MKVRDGLRIAALAGTCLTPIVAAAQSSGSDASAAPATPAPPPFYNNQVSIGAQYQSQDSGQYGKYNGSPNSGGAFIGSFSVGGRDAWDSGSTRYYDATGTNLSTDGSLFMPNASATVRYGNQGQWGVSLFYDGDTRVSSDHFRTVYSTSGGLAPGVAAGGTPWYHSSLLNNSLLTEDAKTKRDTVGGSAFYFLGQSWVLNTNFQHEHKEGVQEQTLLFGNGKSAVPNGTTAPTANGDLVFFPQPIDYDTDRFTVSLGFNRPMFQALLSYSLSSFTDNNTSFKAVDPFTSPSAAAGNGNNLGSGTPVAASYALPPSNSAHQLKGMFGYNITPTTRVNANLGYTLQLQNDAYAAPTFNVNVPSANDHLPQSSLNGIMQNFFGNVVATSRPFPLVDLRGSYTVDYRDNMTGRNRYSFTTNDAVSGGDCSNGCMNIPISVRNQTVAVEGGYHVIPSTKLTLGYTLKLTDRDYAEVNHNTENTLSARVNSNFGHGINGMIGYDHGLRTSSNVNPNAPWLALGYGGSEAPQITYYDAPRTSDSVRTFISVMPVDQLTLGLNAKVTANHYFATQPLPVGTANNAGGYRFGLEDDHTASIGPDLNFAPSSNVNLHAYYNFEEIFRRQTGPGASPGTNGTTPVLSPWTQKTTDQVHTIGLSGDWNAIPDRLKLGANYNFSYGDTSYVLGDGVVAFTGSGLNYLIIPLPDVVAQLHSIGVHGEYQFTPQMSLWVGYTFQYFNDHDFSANYPSVQYGNAILPNNGSGSYVEHIVGVQGRYRW